MMHCLAWLPVSLFLCRASSFATVQPNSTIHGLRNITFKDVSQAALESLDAGASSKRIQQRPTSTVLHSPTISPTTSANATQAEIASARALVADIHASQAVYNKWRLANPNFNTYRSKTSAGTSMSKVRRDEVSPPSLSPEALAAIQLIGHVDATAKAKNGTLIQPINFNTTYATNHKAGTTSFKPGRSHSKRDAADFWMANMDHLGTQPFGGDSSYVTDFSRVWRNVMDYGAVGDGVADDTDAINNAISDGDRCGINCESSSVKGALVYFPMGTYRVTSPIISYYDTQLVGALDPTGEYTGGGPTILAGSTFTGFGVISSDVYLPGGQSEWYIEQSNFYRQIRNLNIDLRQATLDQIAGIHWQVAQATSIQNVWITMTDPPDSTQVGIWAENGSGGWLSEITFIGGWYGFLGGNQQYTVSSLAFHGCENGVGLIWDWAWTWSEMLFTSCNTAINLDPPGASQGDPVGSIYLVDADFVDCNTMIYTFPFASGEQGTTVFTFDNVHFVGNTYFISFTSGNYLVFDVTQDGEIDFATLGDVEDVGTTSDGFYYINVPTRPASLADMSEEAWDYAQYGWFRRAKPAYQEFSANEFFNAKWYAAGDGVTDDTSIIQEMLSYCAEYGYILFFPAGSYMISSPILIPVNSYIVGEVWSQLVAYGSNFADENNPQPMVVVGNGETGAVEIQDLLFTSVGNLPGLILLYWDINSDAQGSAAMWDCHFRVGGALGTNLQVAQCPKLSGGIVSECVAASIVMLIPPTGNGYFENMWLWVADHDIDNAQNTQIDVYVGRGLMCESNGPSWFWGTASEHSVLYQYNFVDASNVFASMIQTESPYFQGSAATQAPAPFQLLWNGDPAFDMCGSATTTCNVAWAVMVQSSENIFINGAGLYSWFQNYDEDCVNTSNCQQRLVNLYNASSLWFNHIITIGSVEVVTPAISNSNNEIIYAANVTQALVYPWWTAIASYLDSASTADNCPVCSGFVAWGDSFSSGVGAGLPYDSDAKTCKRGTGSYPAIFNKLITDFFGVTVDFQFLACSGQNITQFSETSGKGQQLYSWNPATTNVALIQFLINDAYLRAVIQSCLIGYSTVPCDTALTTAENFLADTNPYIDTWFNYQVNNILVLARYAGRPRLMLYWIGYPTLFEDIDNTCDTDYFVYWPSWFGWRYTGEYLTIPLRDRMNTYISKLNQRISRAVSNWNAPRPYTQVVFLDPDTTTNIYDEARFCEPGITEPQSKSNQNSVDFFYPDGPDNVPAGFTLPAQQPGAIGSWNVSLDSINSATCGDDIDLQGDNANFLCEFAQGLAGDPSQIPLFIQENEEEGFDEVTATVEDDGSVTIAAFTVRWIKMFHVKTNANLAIAQLIARNVRWN